MAKATKVPLAPAPFKVVLELTDAEAQALMTVTYKIGGTPGATPRGCMDSIGSALRSVGYENDSRAAVGSIDFKETK